MNDLCESCGLRVLTPITAGEAHRIHATLQQRGVDHQIRRVNRRAPTGGPMPPGAHRVGVSGPMPSSYRLDTRPATQVSSLSNGSAIASASYTYRSDFDNKNKYSCAVVGRSVTLDGIGFGLCQIMSDRNHQPSACNANATRAGIMQRSFGFKPGVPFMPPMCVPLG